jgi:hypothetical protein
MMFKNPAAAVEAPVVFRDESPIPLSVLSLDLDVPPAGWTPFLQGRGIEIVLDSIGRSAISSSDAKMLLDEKHENERRRHEAAVRAEQAAVEADKAWRAALPRGLHWTDVPDGVLPVVAMTAADRAAQPRRTPSRAEWLFNEVDDTMVFHSLQGTDEP